MDSLSSCWYKEFFIFFSGNYTFVRAVHYNCQPLVLKKNITLFWKSTHHLFSFIAYAVYVLRNHCLLQNYKCLSYTDLILMFRFILRWFLQMAWSRAQNLFLISGYPISTTLFVREKCFPIELCWCPFYSCFLIKFWEGVVLGQAQGFVCACQASTLPLSSFPSSTLSPLTMYLMPYVCWPKSYY